MKKTKTIQFFTVVTLLLGLNIIVLGKVLAQNQQQMSLEITADSLLLSAPASIDVPRFVLRPPQGSGGQQLPENEITVVMPPTNTPQTIQVIDPSSGAPFDVTVTLKNISTEYGSIVQTDPTQPVGPYVPVPNNPDETVHVADASLYGVNDTIIVNGSNEHMRVLAVDTANNTLLVERGVDNTEINAVPILADTGFSYRHVLPYSNMGIVTLHRNPPPSPESVDADTSNNPLGTNNVFSDSRFNWYYDPATVPVTDYDDSRFYAFPTPEIIDDPDPNDWQSVSVPVVIMQRGIDTPSSGTYSIGWALRANMTDEQRSGNFTSELTFTLNQ